MNNFDKYKEDYKKLRALGKALYFGFICEYNNHPNVKKAYSTLSKEQKELGENHLFSIDYHFWYNESLRLIKQLMPERLDDFVGFYSASKNRKIINLANYTISDCLLGYISPAIMAR